jgi:hypothetical protein
MAGVEKKAVNSGLLSSFALCAHPARFIEQAQKATDKEPEETKKLDNYDYWCNN